MPTYTYRCGACGEGQEHFLSFSAYKPMMPCACGGEAERSYTDDAPEVIVRGRPRDFKLDATDVPIGWERGNTDCDAQEARYGRIVREAKKAAAANDKQAIKNGIRMIARVPRELDRARRKQFGKDYWDASNTTEIKEKLKADDLLLRN